VSRIANTYAALRDRNELALTIYITAGDPDLPTTRELVLEFARRGADVIELGVPFSDPLADGPVIQAASQRALQVGTALSGILETVRSLREDTEIPIVLMTCYNPLLQYGLQRFVENAVDAGVDGTLVSDLPPEEAEEWLAADPEHRLDRVFLLAPTSSSQRMDLVCRYGSGFIYCVARAGVTGERKQLPPDLKELVHRIRTHTDLPIAIGFGISRPEHVRQIREETEADGVVVGSAVVRLIGEGRPVSEVGESVAALKGATR